MAPINEDSPINNKKIKYVIGIDFGTTFTGAAYVFIEFADRKDIHDISGWPKNNSLNLLKIPTVIRYHKNDKDIYKCGLEAFDSKAKINNYGPTINLFKLHLHDGTKDGIPSLPEGMTIVQVISDYLKYIYANICRDMFKRLGTKQEEKEKTKALFRYCLTVPAIWTSKAKSVMRQASILAGIIDEHDHVDRLVLVGEPEAAALYAEKMRGGITINSGETLMIVDAGGGTIDLTTFEKTITGETKCFKEITEGVGNTYGSSKLDLFFKEYILRKMMPYPPLAPVFLDKVMEQFKIRVKPDFGEISEDTVFFDIPDERHIVEEGFKLYDTVLEIPVKTLEVEVFDPVIKEVLNLVQFQLNRLNGTRLDYIILVGGFGQSKYLLKKMKDKFKDLVGDIIVPDQGEAAVTRGAVYFGLDPYSISHRRMRLSYGVCISSPFIEGVDRLDYKRKDNEGNDVCINRFDAIVKKGEDVSIQTGFSRPYFTFNSGACRIKLYGYEGDTIPRYVSDTAKRNTNVDREAYKVAEFVLTLPERKPGKKIDFTMEIYFGHMEIKVEVALPGVQKKETFIASYDQRVN